LKEVRKPQVSEVSKFVGFEARQGKMPKPRWEFSSSPIYNYNTQREIQIAQKHRKWQDRNCEISEGVRKIEISQLQQDCMLPIKIQENCINCHLSVYSEIDTKELVEKLSTGNKLSEITA
jgi:hypothetical protein